ncbi:MAG: DUF896 domain-containing protein [Clostridiales Family XIII bacterium]|jgi:uncharacterized protein YnzC (UPF0291/DUF896 family)|nr:DUF896 domain-containing protein [Clostridiales Family XIII bacterium]
MLENDKMNRINELARASKERALDESERAEQAALRKEYLGKFRSAFRAQLEQIEIASTDVDGGKAGCSERKA